MSLSINLHTFRINFDININTSFNDKVNFLQFTEPIYLILEFELISCCYISFYIDKILVNDCVFFCHQ